MIDGGALTGSYPNKLEQRILQDNHSFNEIRAILVTHGHAGSY